MSDTYTPDRLCILCRHFHYDPGSPRYSEITPGDPAALDCNQGHWEYIIGASHGEIDLLANMLHAETCADYEYIPIDEIKRELESRRRR